MIRNYITISFRQLMKNRVFSFINIFGLTLGFLCLILLALYVHDELSFDTFHRDADRMYQAIAREKQIKGGSRKAKEKLIQSMNSEWTDLFEEVSKW